MNLLKRAFLRLNHYIFANTLHGTHSPFVYHFLEDVVYQPNINSKNKYEQLIERIINSREEGKVLVIDESIKPNHLLDYYFKECAFADDQSIFVFTDIRGNEERFAAWGKIIADSKNNISIDLFDIGILFFDQKKPKEHFNIYY
jgi:hypothetical protein